MAQPWQWWAEGGPADGSGRGAGGGNLWAGRRRLGCRSGHACVSSAIADIRYDPEASALHVTFVDGDRYRYAAVPAAVYRAFIDAESKGRFFATDIRDRYPYQLLD